MTSSPPPPPASRPLSPQPPGGASADFTIQRGETVNLPAGITLRFSHHGHKDVTPEMGPSPLMFGGMLTKPGVAPEDFTVNVHLEHSKRFTISDEEFELVDYDYERSMHLRYLGHSR